MLFSEMIEGLQILAKYEEKGLGTHLAGAEHDVIYGVGCSSQEVGTPDEYGLRTYVDPRISEEDAARLDALGWFINEYDCWSHHA